MTNSSNKTCNSLCKMKRGNKIQWLRLLYFSLVISTLIYNPPPPPPSGPICCFFLLLVVSNTIYFLGMLWPIHHLPDSGRSLHRNHIFRLFSFFLHNWNLFCRYLQNLKKIQVECYHCEFGWSSLCWMVLIKINFSFLTTLGTINFQKNELGLKWCCKNFLLDMTNIWYGNWNEKTAKLLTTTFANCSSPVIYFMPPKISFQLTD